MDIVEVATKIKRKIIISKAADEDFRLLTKKRYSFVWRSFKDITAVYKLQIKAEEDILGVIGLIDTPGEKRVEIKLLASAKENIGIHKIYDGIAGCLIAFACRTAVEKYGAAAGVSLVPKTNLKRHYMKKYGMLDAGWQIYLEGKQINTILKEYFI